MRYSVVEISSVTITFMLGSTSATPGPPHLHSSRFDTPIRLFFFLFLLLSSIHADSGWNQPKSAEIC